MKIDQAGHITWPVKYRPVGGVVNVKINIKNHRGESIWQSFELAVTRKLNHNVGPGDRPRDHAAVGFVTIDDTRLELPAAPTSTTLGLGGRQLVLCDNKLAILGDDGWTPQEILVMDKSYLKIVEREDYYVAIANQPNVVDLIDKQSLKVTKSLSLPSNEMLDIAIHPKLPISYIASRNNVVDGVSNPELLVFDETTAEIKKKPQWIGTSVVVDPTGKNLHTGYSNVLGRTSGLVLNPTRWKISKRRGSVAWLVHYKLDQQGIPELSSVKENVGDKGRGIRLSANGKRITYLSVAGFPKRSKNLGAWDPHTLADSPVGYATKDIASCQSFAFHNLLPLGASPGKNRISFYDQDTGQLKKGLIKAVPTQFKTDETSLLYFSPGGKHVIVQGETNGIHYLQKLELNLSERELIDADKPVVIDVVSPK